MVKRLPGGTQGSLTQREDGLYIIKPAQDPRRRMSVRARKVIRKMRGGTQAHLIEGDDGHFYVEAVS